MDNLSRGPALSGMKGNAHWERWLEKGHAHDARVRYRARFVTISLASLIALGLAIGLTVR